jgi:hypothetical protein
VVMSARGNAHQPRVGEAPTLGFETQSPWDCLKDADSLFEMLGTLKASEDTLYCRARL